MKEDAMSLKNWLDLARKLAVLTCLTMLCLAVATFASGLADISMLTGPSSDSGSPSAADAFLPTLLLALLLAAVYGIVIIRSRWHGWRLMLAVFVSFFGLMTVMTHSESAVFLGHTMPGGLILRLVAMGAIFAGLFAPVAVLVMGRLRASGLPALGPQPGKLPLREWMWRIMALGAVYLLIYNVFGYFIAWKSPAVQTFYAGIDEGTFLRHLASLWKSWPWMFPFQFGRGILWALFGLPIIRMYSGKRWETALMVALLFSVWSAQLLSPNPFMPQAVARIHFAETSTSNFLFGCMVGLLLSRPTFQPSQEIQPATGNNLRRRLSA
jgi:hypothetical protein